MFCVTRLSLILGLAALAASTPARAAYQAFNVTEGSAEDADILHAQLQAKITIILSNSKNACEDWRNMDMQQGKSYLHLTLYAQPTDDLDISGCYDLVDDDRQGDLEPCETSRGKFKGVELLRDPEDENGVIGHELTDGRVTLEKLDIDEDGNAILGGFVNVRLGDMATGGVLQAALCSDLD